MTDQGRTPPILGQEKHPELTEASQTARRPELLPIVEDRLGEVGVRFTATTGGQALCRLDRHLASAKDLEGRMAMLLELRRALRKDPQADVDQIADRWRADLERRRAGGSPVAWLAYLSGGLAEVDQLRARS